MIPVTLITGFLGTGKTTAIRQLLTHAPSGARWAVLVNEFGEVDIDGAALHDGDLEVRAVAGGCICCATALPFRVALVTLLRQVRPDRVIIEPSGLADPASLLDTLRGPGLRDAVAPRATITLVHPLRFFDERFAAHPVYQNQIAVADVLASGFADTSRPDHLQRFRDAAAALDPPKLVVATTARGDLDPGWLDLEPAPRQAGPLDPRGPLVIRRDAGVATVVRAVDHGFTGHGRVWPPAVTFDRDALEDALHTLVGPASPMAGGVVRLKGIFRTPRRWLRVDADPDRVSWMPVAWRRDSRVQIIAASGAASPWDAVDALLDGATRSSDRP